MVGVGRTTLYKLMDTRELASVHVGSSRRIPLSAVYEFVDRLGRPTIGDSDKRP
jgi:excisionase family DNA binding protein